MIQTDKKAYCVLGLEESTLLKWPYYARIYRFSAIHIKLPTAFFTELEQKIFKFVHKYKKGPKYPKQSWKTDSPT